MIRVLSVLHFFNDGYLAALPLLLPFISKDIHLSLAGVGFLGMALNFSGVVLALPAGILAARFGAVRVLRAGVLLYAGSYALVAISFSAPSLVAVFCLAGIGFGVFHPVGFSAVARAAESSPGKQMGAFAAIGDMGRIALAAGVTFLVAAIQWKLTAFLYSIMAFVLFTVLLFFGKKSAATPSEFSRNKKAKKVPLDLSLFKNRRFLFAMGSSVLDAFASSSLFIFLPFLLVFRGIDTALLGSFTGAFFAGNFLGKTFIGRLIDRAGYVKTFVVCEVLMAIFVVVMALVNNFILIMTCAVVIGILTKGTVPVTNTMVAESVRRTGSFESAYSVSSLVIGIANTIAPLFFGFLAEFLGVQSVFFFCSFMAVLAIIPAALMTKS